MDQENLGCTAVAVIGGLTILSVVFCCVAHFYASSWAVISVWTAGIAALLALLGHILLSADDFKIMFRAALAVNLICLFVVVPLYTQVT